MKKYFLVLVTLFLIGCGISPIKYQATGIEIKEAVDLVEEMTWSQHTKWRPESIVINDKYMAWSFGYASQNNVWATDVGTGFAVGGGTSTSRYVGSRSYYRSIDKIQLYSWKRKLMQWYAVGIIDKNGVNKFVLRTRSLKDAKLFTNAMTSIVNFYKNKE